MANTPRPQVFAVMRNGHEVIRGMSKDLRETLENNDAKAFIDTWKVFSAWLSYHAKMEDGVEGKGMGMFALLDAKFDKIAEKNKLRNAHDELHAVEHKLSEAMKSGDVEQIKAAWEKFSQVNLDHLKEEENVMMPCVQKMAKAGENLVEHLQTQICNTCWDEDGFGAEFLTTGVRVLEKHHEGMPRARVWIHAIQTIANDEQWKKWLPAIKEGLSDKMFQEIDELIGMTSKVK
eukprot:CAMPEP_0204855586 /NCGR_PEP_ID=MMETSP1347-20130617/17083_1 /ASSEMBLY_ACC=CAM_ASM_000690 /TAXON_ID=215587 /ORGANISM="Aplanochytrium stocchinoi, Strain GSBS06" /LENGTH=232 /DNA_ID=CAMNT_0052001837 /DNA_START=35 /DNA_END=733 /DNA_ORIENTATION=+